MLVDINLEEAWNLRSSLAVAGMVDASLGRNAHVGTEWRRREIT